MSVDQAKAFFDKVEQDPALQQQLQSTQEQIAATAKKAGYTFTPEEMRQHLQQRFGVSAAALPMKPYTLA